MAERRPSQAAALVYAAFVAYGSLLPFAWRERSVAQAWEAFLNTPYLHLTMGQRADWVANVLLYIPLGFLLAGCFRARLRDRAADLWAAAACALLALAVEFAQLYFPPRTVSLNDLLAECLGALLGIALWRAAGRPLLQLWSEALDGGHAGARALVILYSSAYLAFSLFPYDFIVSATELAQKLAAPGRTALLLADSCSGGLACGSKLAAEVLTVAPLGALLGLVSSRPVPLARALALGLALGVAIEGAQTFLASGVSQGISILTRGLGMALGLAIYRFFRREWLVQYRAPVKFALLLALPLYGALLLALNGFFASALVGWAAARAKLGEVRFLPFYYHYFTSETQAMYSLLVHAGAYAPIGALVWMFRNGKADRAALWVSASLAFVTAGAMETLKLFLDGKKPDPTDALIAAAAAACACFALIRLAQWQPSVPAQPAPRRAHRSRGALWSGAALAGLIAFAGWLIAVQPREHYVDESKLPQLPMPGSLPAVSLPAFRNAHPRLPNPAVGELALLRAHNPAFLQEVSRRAAGGSGDFYEAALQELIEPGSVDLGLLHRRLTALQPSGRGETTAKTLALAYDWLHARWSEPQRRQLRDKLAQACFYVIEFIRKERLSPYNVILYNAPLQGLMACSVALHRDDPRGDAIMAFTHDLWKNRVLPVWRQVMGVNGGWHEGGEYVGIGIGQAIYELPAVWRHATGEDLIASEPGLRGFLDFLVYRTQPDGTHFRWGDAAWFDRSVPNAAPLALELRHAAAYSLRAPSGAPVPSAWPWGPLTDASLFDPAARERLPWQRHFDGIGMVVARSDWSPEATYVSFKAGDNYWSHTHLDQGAFTIYKGGPLAIDSGFYGPAYGSDHHMNYAYQTIAHNTLTVTDPKDTVPAPGPEALRPIANDGGQRRIGSGWGVEAAPLDRDEWEAKREIYHTGRLERVFEGDDLLVALADVTPAYTNAQSGGGTFSHRTRRVERFWRMFAYDRVDDVVLVFDQVVASDASFRKRWLLHTLEAPSLHADGFSVFTSPRPGPGRAGGRLEGKVLLPKEALLHAIGGRGFEFFVDDRNYDEAGRLPQIVAKLSATQAEPGAWRIEVMPRQDAAQDLFLVVLLPTSGSAPSHRVRLLESGERVGCEIAGAHRTTRWWFEPGRNLAAVEVSSDRATRTFRIEAEDAAPALPPQRSWRERFSRLVHTAGN